jgi:hypothetical protein
VTRSTATLREAAPIPPALLDESCEQLRVRVSVAFMLAGAVEVEARLAVDIDPELHKLLAAAHGQALHVMSRERNKLRDARRVIRERDQTQVGA